MILRIFGDGKKPFPMGCAEGLAPCLIGEFSALLAMRLGKFPNKLWYFLAEIPPCVIGMPIEPACGLCSLHSLYPLCSLYRVCRTSRTAVAISMLAQPKLSIYYFSFRSVGGGAVVSVCKGFSCMGQSEARFSR